MSWPIFRTIPDPEFACRNPRKPHKSDFSQDIKNLDLTERKQKCQPFDRELINFPALKRDAVCSSEMLVTDYRNVWCNLSQYLTNLMHKSSFTIRFISCLYMIRAYMLIIRRSKLHYTDSGIITAIVVKIPEAV